MNDGPALIFDFGNVVAHFDYGRAADRLGRSLGITGEDFLRTAREAGFVELLKDFESGGMTSEAFHGRIAELTGLGVGFEEFAAAWEDIFRPNPSVHRLIAALHRRGHRLVLGSNTNALHAPHFRRQFEEVLRHFDRIVLSHEVGRVKPHPAFYLACASAAGRPPDECLFIDDLAENVEGARRAGLTGVLYVDTPRLVRDLGRLGVDVPTDAPT